MSNAQTTLQNETSSAPVEGHPDAQSLRETLLSPVRAVSFWAAVWLPFLYLPLLFTGLDGHLLYVFVGLLAANGLALALGQDYTPE